MLSENVFSTANMSFKRTFARMKARS